MKATKKDYPNLASTHITPFHIREMMVALELGPADQSVLDYLDFLSALVPIRSVYFAHILPPLRLFNPTAEAENMIFSHYELNLEAISQMRTELEARPINQKVEHLGFEVHKGNPLEELIKSAREVFTDLMVIGQRSGAGEHGVLARNLARRVENNALIIPEKAWPKLKCIMVPFDFSEYSIRSLKIALAIQAAVGEELKVVPVHVYEMPNLSIYKVQKTFDQLKSMVESDRKDAFRDLLNIYLPDYTDKLELKLIEQNGPGVARFLLKAAEEVEADLVVIGAKGHSRVERLLLGSVTEKLCSINEKIPTMIVKR
ncbi:MAG: universal stress protein [Bacteroidota bacterium]